MWYTLRPWIWIRIKCLLLVDVATSSALSVYLQRIPPYFTEKISIFLTKPPYSVPAGMFIVTVPDYYLKGEGEAGRVGYRMLLWATACMRIP